MSDIIYYQISDFVSYFFPSAYFSLYSWNYALSKLIDIFWALARWLEVKDHKVSPHMIRYWSCPILRHPWPIFHALDSITTLLWNQGYNAKFNTMNVHGKNWTFWTTIFLKLFPKLYLRTVLFLIINMFSLQVKYH